MQCKADTLKHVYILFHELVRKKKIKYLAITEAEDIRYILRETWQESWTQFQEGQPPTQFSDPKDCYQYSHKLNYKTFTIRNTSHPPERQSFHCKLLTGEKVKTSYFCQCESRMSIITHTIWTSHRWALVIYIRGGEVGPSLAGHGPYYQWMLIYNPNKTYELSKVMQRQQNPTRKYNKMKQKIMTT